LIGESEVKRPLGRPRCRWENNIRLDIRKIVLKGVDLIPLAHDRDQWCASFEQGNEPSGSIKSGEFLD
jgi:hypothetical protein